MLKHLPHHGRKSPFLHFPMRHLLSSGSLKTLNYPLTKSLLNQNPYFWPAWTNFQRILISLEDHYLLARRSTQPRKRDSEDKKHQGVRSRAAREAENKDDDSDDDPFMKVLKNMRKREQAESKPGSRDAEIDKMFEDFKKMRKKHQEKWNKMSDSEKEDEFEKNKGEFFLTLGGAALAAFLTIYFLIRVLRRDKFSENDFLGWTEFIKKVVPTGQIKSIHITADSDVAKVELNFGARATDGTELHQYYQVRIPDFGRFESEVRAAETAAGIPPTHWAEINIDRPEDIAGPLLGFTFLLLLFFLMTRAMKGIKSFNISDMMSQMMKHKINIIDPKAKNSKLKIKFNDVAGLHEAKVEISEFVDYLRTPAKFTRLGAKLPKGAMMTGPPGCGKTLLAKALAAESSAPFISMNGTEFVEMIGGLGAQRVRNLFKEAKSRAPCIIYIDEIDAIGRKRQDSAFGGSNSEEEQTLNQLLVEMDGMDTAQGVVVIGSTNRPDILDKALLRPGRFDRHISVDMPTLLERKEMFELYLRKVKIENRLMSFSQRLAQMTPGMTGADIANVVNEAAIHAATAQRKMVLLEDIDFALNKIIAGPEKKTKILVAEERETVAVHETGHALVGWLLEHTDALLKVTIIPRTSAALGFAQYTSRDKKLYTKEELFERMCMMLGGRAAENVVFGRITTGAANDLEKVRKQAYAMTRNYGMSETLGPLSFTGSVGEEGDSQFQKKPYSQRLGKLIDEEVSKMVAEAYFATEKLLRDNRDKLDTITKALLERETLNYEDVKKLIGPPKFGEKHVVDLAEHVLPDPEDLKHDL